MKTISVTELEARLSEQLHQVEAGADIERLVSAGLARPGALLDAEFWSLPRAEPSGSLVAALLDEREEGR